MFREVQAERSVEVICHLRGRRSGRAVPEFAADASEGGGGNPVSAVRPRGPLRNGATRWRILAARLETKSLILFASRRGLMIILGVMKLITLAHGAFLRWGGYTAMRTKQAGVSPGLAPAALWFSGFARRSSDRALIVTRPLY